MRKTKSMGVFQAAFAYVSSLPPHPDLLPWGEGDYDGRGCANREWLCLVASSRSFKSKMCRVVKDREARDFKKAVDCCSLSPRERARVRGKGASKRNILEIFKKGRA